MKKLLSILKQPYPYYSSSKKTIQNAFWLFLFITLFLFLFSPFNINKSEDKYSYIITCLLHSICATVIYVVFVLLLNQLTNTALREENWKVYKAILLIAAALFLIGLGSFFLRPFIYNNPNNFSWRYFIEEVVNTFILGTLIFGIFTLIDFYRLFKANQLNASIMEQHIDEHKSQEENIEPQKQTLQLLIESEPFELNTQEFLFAKAEGNYVTFYLSQNNNLVKQLKRISLKNIEDQLGKENGFLIRTHRAYFINASHITKVAGNAQGYQLTFPRIDFTVPVSRAMIPAFKLVMNSI